jgi:nucleoside-diphosphate-sugar epimerase
MITGERIFITGGTGFIASYLCERLAEENEVVLYDTMARNALRHTALTRHPRVRIVTGDVLDLENLKRSMPGATVAIHCAAIAGVYSVVKNPSLTMKINCLGTYNVLEVAQREQVRRFVDFSTSEVYGPHTYKVGEDELTAQGPPTQRRWVYAVSKLAGEHFAHVYHQEFGLPVVTVRPFNVYGPRQVGDGAIRSMSLRALQGEPITLYGDGTQIRAWCYIDDFVAGVLACLEKPQAVGQVFNIGNPLATVTNFELAQIINRLAGSGAGVVFADHPGPEVQVRVPSIDRARQLLGFEPRVGLEEGVERTLAWYRLAGPSPKG